MSTDAPRGESNEPDRVGEVGSGAGDLPTISVPGAGPGGRQMPDQATEAVPVETAEHRQRPLTPVSLLLTLFLAYFLYKVQIVVVLLIVGILLATAIAGPVELLSRRFRLPRPLSILLVYLAILAGLGGLIYLLIPPVVREGTRFAQELPDLLTSLRTQLETSANPLIRNAAMRVFQVVDDRAQGGSIPVPTDLAFGVVSGIGSGIVTLFTIFLIAFYWITEKTLIKRAVAGLFAPGQRARVHYLWSEVEVKLGSWLRGQVLLMVVIGTLATVAYGTMGLHFWLILGVIAGLTEAIPNVGPVLGAIPAVLVALAADWKLALAVVVFVTVLQLLENAVLVPRIMKGAVGLSPLAVILAILAGSEFRGVAGALLAVPIAGALSVILADLMREKHEREAAEERQSGTWPRWAWRRRGM